MQWKEEGPSGTPLHRSFLLIVLTQTQIGINYAGTDAELKGCINDVLNVKRFLCCEYSQFGL